MILARYLRCLAFAFLTIITFHKANAQREAFHWIGHQGLKLDFRKFPFSWDLSAAQLNSFKVTPASISDKNGNLLFYYNGGQIYNSRHKLMQGAQDTLNADKITSGNDRKPIIVPISGCKYYVFSDSREGGWFRYHVVDMSKNDGEGQVVSVNNTFVPNSIFVYNMSATFHANGKDVWLIAKDVSRSIYAFLIEYETGLIRAPIKVLYCQIV